MLQRNAVTLDSNHGSFKGRHCFWCFSNFVQKNCYSVYVETVIRSEGLGLVKHNYSIQAIILICLIRLQGVLKICVSFADKYSRPRYQVSVGPDIR